jgi:hypothetical protein
MSSNSLMVHGKTCNPFLAFAPCFLLSINENAGEWICLEFMKAKAKSKSVSVNTPIEFYHLKCHLLQRIPIKTGN